MSSGKDFIPGPDGEFDDFFKGFHGAVTKDPAGFGLTPADAASVDTAYTTWTTAYDGHKQAVDDARKAAAIKEDARQAGEKAVRGATKKINGHPTVDNAMRAKANLPAHDLVKTAGHAPSTRPIGRLEAHGHTTLVIHFVDEATPHKNAKPHGVHACEIRVHVGDPAPADETGYTFLAHDTRTPYIDQHPAADAGKTAYYILRWLSPNLEPGPWSDVVSAKIPL